VNLDQFLSWIIPSAESCREQAAKLQLEHPGAPREQVARAAIKDARKWAMAMGAATGAAANPITLLPAALAEAAAMLRIEGQIAGVIAALLDPASLDDDLAFRRDILRVIFPGAVSQVLRRIGVKATERATKQMLQQAVTRGVFKEIAEHVAKSFGGRIAGKALVTKTVPLVSAGIGAAWNWIELQGIGRRAIEYHLTGELPEVRATRRVTSTVKEQTSKLHQRLRRKKEQ
jgi:hypothetical protein